LIDSAIRLSQHEAMILGMDVQPRDALEAAEHNGLTIDDIRELVELYHKNTATLTKAIDVTPQDLTPTLQIEPPAEPEPTVDIASVKIPQQNRHLVNRSPVIASSVLRLPTIFCQISHRSKYGV
jgi:hypothetical protein